jgi:hypothetical protein
MNTSATGGTGKRSLPVQELENLVALQHWQTLLASATRNLT